MTHACRHRDSHTGRRRAFTLTELIVAVGILVALMAVVGGVFSLSGKAASQATAVMTVHRQLRMLRETLRQDLSGVDPTRSCMAVAAVLQSTYETPIDRENGVLSDHRADVLMFFTETPQRSYINRIDGLGNPRPAEAPAQIVYGHANLADINPTSSNPTTFPPVINFVLPIRAVESATMNASDWRLSRRVVHFNNLPEQENLFWIGTGPNAGPGFINAAVLESENDRADLRPFDYDKWIAGNGLFTTAGTNGTMLWNQWRPNLQTDFFYNGPNTRTILDPDPPVGFGDQLAYDLLPGVADFKVEYTYDDPSDAALIRPVLWIDPLLVTGAPYTAPGLLPGRMEWQAGNPDQIAPRHVNSPGHAARSGSFSSDYNGIAGVYGLDPVDLGTGVPYVKPRTWPKAIRITMRVYDPRGVLAENTTKQQYQLGGGPRPIDLQSAPGNDRDVQFEPIEFVYVHAF